MQPHWLKTAKALDLSFIACEPLHKHSLAKSKQKGSKTIRFSSHFNYQTLPKCYREIMTCNMRSDYPPLLMVGWQYRAFVIQFRPESDIEAGRFEGRVEHIASYSATRFHRSRGCLVSSQAC